MRMLFAASSHDDLVRIVCSVRNRWRLKIVLRGLSILAAVGITALLISAYGMDLFRFDDTAVLVFRIVVYVNLALVTIWFLVLPLTKRVSDERVALYLEEHEPSLGGHVMTGIELGKDVDEENQIVRSPELSKQLVRRAIEKCVSVEEGRRVEQKSLWSSSGLLAGATVVGMAFFLLNPPFLRHGAPFLLSPWSGADVTNPYAIEVTPGNVSIARGADVRVSAVLRSFDAAEVDLAVKRGEDGSWDRWPMVVDDETAEHVLLLFDVDEQTEYFVEASGVRSQMFRIDVSDLPYVGEINLEYFFPAYTGLSPRRQDGSGDIAAVTGTRVQVEILPTMDVTSGAVVVDETDTTALEIAEDGSLVGSINVTHEGMYRVLLGTPTTGVVVGSPDYFIDVLVDLPPTVSIDKPGRDIRVTSIEEVFTQVTSEDDYGIGGLELIYSINGGDQQTVDLYSGRGARRELSASHTFYLEEAELVPGDIVSYYARAVEVARGGGEREASSDIYFFEVRPFDHTYRQAESRGGQMQGQGGGGENRDDLSAQQRQIIAGTFNLIRDRWRYTDTEFGENLATLALAQGRARGEVATLSDRILTRGITQVDSTFAAITEALDTAAAAMEQAEELLRAGLPQEALSPEQRALQHLLRAEAMYGETEVSQQQGGGGGGGGNQANAEDLADLFELELDRMRNQYEEVQRGRREQADQELDEVMQRLRELARRQQQQNERMRAQQQNMQNQSGGGGGAEGQRRLAEEAEELARQLERLSREENRPDLEETARDLREASEAMRQAAANARNNGVAQGAEALDELREARRLLDRNRSARLARDASETMRRVERLAEEQSEMIEDVSELSNDLRERRDAAPPLQERKEGMAEEVAELEAELDRMSRESRQEQPEASRSLGAAARSIRDNQLREKLLWSRGVIQERTSEYVQSLEAVIESDIEDLRELVQQGVDAIGETQAQRLVRSLDRTTDAVTALESMSERLQERLGQGQEQQGQQGEGGGRGRISQEDERQFTREFREQLQELLELRRELAQGGFDVGDLDEVINQMGSMDRRGTIGEALGVAQLESAVIQGLKEFEFNLRRQLQLDGDQRLFLSGSDAVPEGYRELVEEYFRQLSRRRGGDSGAGRR